MREQIIQGNSLLVQGACCNDLLRNRRDSLSRLCRDAVGMNALLVHVRRDGQVLPVASKAYSYYNHIRNEKTASHLHVSPVPGASGLGDDERVLSAGTLHTYSPVC